MDEFTTKGMTDAQMKDINRCIIYLQVFYTSDTTDLAGITIDEWAKKGNGKAIERVTGTGRSNKGHLQKIGQMPSRALQVRRGDPNARNEIRGSFA
jgi:hypothetical protein